jgi:spore coat polysaccharide biosynthesis protein SpsF (cytidylyltransferase family)
MVVNEIIFSNVDYVEGFVPDEGVNFGIHGVIPAAIRTKALEKICKMKTTTNTETGYKEFFTNNKIIKSKLVKLDPSLEFPKDIRLILDYSEDFELAKEIFCTLGNGFKTKDILELLRKA